MSRLKVVTGKGEHFEAGFAKTARTTMEWVLAEGAVVIAILYETPRGVAWASVPNASAVTVGLLKKAVEQIETRPEDDGAEREA